MIGFRVTPYAGVWIEICAEVGYCPVCGSLPTRECGLKFLFLHPQVFVNTVTPYAGVWIEMGISANPVAIVSVTPYAGVWIEMSKYSLVTSVVFGHSLRGSVD